MPINPLTRSGTINKGVAHGPGMSTEGIRRDQYGQRFDVRNIHTGDNDFYNSNLSKGVADSAHERWKLKPNGVRFTTSAAEYAKELFDARSLTDNGGKRRYTYHKKSKRSHSKTGGRRRKYSTTKKHRRGRK
jgi:hypothetical protein